jgi:hypothetical protein
MKMTYKKPETLLIFPYGQIVMNSVSGDRGTGGGPTDKTDQDGDPLPTTVGETDGQTDPFAGHGQNTGGQGTRAKSGMIWDEW